MFGPVSEGMRLFRRGSSVVVVGYSEKPHRMSAKVAQYLIGEGNRVTGVNPNVEPGHPTKVPVKKRLSEINEAMDVIQVFRNSTALALLADEILSLPWTPKMVWCQQGVVDFHFQQKLEKAGVPVVMDACPYALRSYL